MSRPTRRAPSLPVSMRVVPEPAKGSYTTKPASAVQAVGPSWADTALSRILRTTLPKRRAHHLCTYVAGRCTSFRHDSCSATWLTAAGKLNFSRWDTAGTDLLNGTSSGVELLVQCANRVMGSQTSSGIGHDAC